MENKTLIFIVIVFISSTLGALSHAGVEYTPANHLLLYEISPHSYPKLHMDYVCILNPSHHQIALGSYYLTDFEGYLKLRGTLNSNEKLYIAENATSFRNFFGFSPEYTYRDIYYNGTFALSNTGDDVALIHDSQIADIVVYGNKKYSGHGWHGAPVGNVSSGHILRRISLRDTNTSADWSTYHRIGQSDFAPLEKNTNIEIFTYPDDYRETFSFLSMAKKEILIE